MLKLKDFQDFQVMNSAQIKGGDKVRTDGGTHYVFMNHFDFVYDYKIDTANGWHVAFCTITNNTVTDGGNVCGGPECDEC